MSNRLHWEFLEALGGDKDVIITSEWVKADFYASAWVDVDAGDGFSKAASEVCKESFDNSRFVEIMDFSSGNFRGPKWIKKRKGLPNHWVSTLAPDGVWTKPTLSDASWTLTGSPYDLFAMTWDDIARYGWTPTVFTSVLDVANIGDAEEKYVQMMHAFSKVAKQQCVVILNWETAELPGSVSSPNPNAIAKYNWAGMMDGFFDPNRMITWEHVEPGDILVALKQDGFRSNGISAVREAFRLEYGNNWYKDAPMEEIQAAAAPSVPYARAMAEANGWYNTNNDFRQLVPLSWIAHLSGWSLKWKLLEDMLGVNWLSAELDNLFDIPDSNKKAAIWSQKWKKPMKSIAEMASTWCIGQGMIGAMKPKYADWFIDIMSKQGIEAQKCWRVIETPSWKKPSIHINNIK